MIAKEEFESFHKSCPSCGNEGEYKTLHEGETKKEVAYCHLCFIYWDRVKNTKKSRELHEKVFKGFKKVEPKEENLLLVKHEND